MSGKICELKSRADQGLEPMYEKMRDKYSETSARRNQLNGRDVGHPNSTEVQATASDPQVVPPHPILLPGRQADCIGSLQRAGGNAAVAQLLAARRPFQPTLQREEKPESRVPTPSNPFDVPAVQVEVDKLAIEALRPLVITLSSTRYTDYQLAISNVKGELKEEKERKEQQDEETFKFALSVMLIPVGGVVEALAEKAAGSEVLERLQSSVQSNGPKLAKLAGIEDSNMQIYLTNEVYEKVSGDSLKRLAEKFDVATAKKKIEDGIDKGKDRAASLSAKHTEYELGFAFLDALSSAASSAIGDLTTLIAGTETYEGLMAFYNAFHGAKIDIYKAEVRQNKDDFMREMAAALSGKSNDVIVKLNAYGGERYAHVKHHLAEEDSGSYYVFMAWVTPDMEQMAKSKNPPQIEPSEVHGHIPAPTLEEGMRVVRISGKMAMVKIEDEGNWFFGVSKYGAMKFVRWIDESERAAAEARGAEQIGGINDVADAAVEGVPAA